MKLTQKDLPWCNELLRKWQKKLGLLDMKFYLSIKKLESKEGVKFRGLCTSTYEGKHSSIDLSNDEEAFANKQDVEMTIFHELLEAMLSEINGELHVNGVSQPKIQRLVHDVIRRLENFVFDDIIK